MIERYSRKEISDVWSEENKFKIWLEIELLAVEARVHLKEVPRSVYNQIRSKANFNIKRIKQIEEKVHHDVIAFITDVAKSIGKEGKLIHYGMTSSDVLDTCLAVQIKQASKILLTDLEKLRDTLKKLAQQHKYLVCIGRTHGVHAELTTYGLKFALWYDEILRNIERLKSAAENAAIGKISGAVGTYEHLSPEIEEYVCNKLGIKPARISTQIVQRDVHAEYLLTLALIASTLEKIATEIRHLQKTEVREVEEPFAEGQKGSSAMPHKRNPIICERIAGLARLIRTNAFASLENINLWHERDISHSSVERIIFPDTTILLDYILDKMNFVLSNLKFNPEQIEKNIELTKGLIHSQKVLLALIEKGLSREDAYKLVQTNAMKVWDGETDFKTELLSDPKILKYLNADEIEKIFDHSRLIERVDYIFNRLGLK
ncbi:MAG: adenylosuccinate lyase [Ignavibacteria bacterium]|jgi:adenylosuccinate lyase|nr:adenylosuccinate lyase [Ignavibacteria bacterium]MDH7527603.1 adenylosuccinate lyase [Ignavibacteria bacterium]